MKKTLVSLGLLFALCITGAGMLLAQNSVGKLFADLKGKLGEVTIDKMVYNQSVEVLDETKGKVRYESIAVSEKGESVKSGYEFYISDIDKNTIIRKPSGKKFFVSFWLNNKQKFIKYYKDDKFEAYTDNIEIMVIDADVAQSVADILKSAIPLVKNTEKNWNTAVEALNFLKTGIGEVKDKTTTIELAFNYNEKKNYLVGLTAKTTDSKGLAIEEKYDFNLLDLNKSKLLVKVSGTSLNVVLETKNSDKFIQYTKGGVLQNYVNNIEIASDDIDAARSVIAALTAAIDKSKVQLTEFKTTQSALDFIIANVGDVVIDTKTYKQKISFAAGNGTSTTYVADESDSKGKTISNKYELYLADAEPGSVKFKVTGKKIIIPVAIAGKYKFIKYSKDNVVQNFTEDFEISAADIEGARELAAAFNTAIKGSVETPVKFNSVAEAIKFIQGNISGSAIGTDQYKLVFDGNATEPFACTYSRSLTDAKGITSDESYLFYPYMLDASSVKVESEGKYLSVNALVSAKKPFVKKVKKDQISFISDLSLMLFDVKKAKDVAGAIRYLAANTTPKAKAWGNKSEALGFVAQNMVNISGGGKEIKQKLDIAEDNACKITLTVNTSDEKGKTVEELFEFTLSDINKQLVDFKTQGANIAITLSCKNKQKLIKAYKDGVQQSFGSDVSILCTDVEVAKNIGEALKSAISQCE